MLEKINLLSAERLGFGKVFRLHEKGITCAYFCHTSLQYELDELKGVCLEKMFPDITADNAAQVVIVADLYGADDLKTAAMTFIRR